MAPDKTTRCYFDITIGGEPGEPRNSGPIKGTSAGSIVLLIAVWSTLNHWKNSLFYLYECSPLPQIKSYDL